MSDFSFPSFNYPYTSAVDIRHSLLDYGKTGPLLVVKDHEGSIRCVPQKKNIAPGRSRLTATKPTLPLNPPQVSDFHFERSYLERWWHRDRNEVNFSTDYKDVMHGTLGELVRDEISQRLWQKWKVGVTYITGFGYKVVPSFDQQFCDIPLEVLRELLNESFEEEDCEIMGKYYGNCLVHQINSSNEGIVLTYPAGELMDTLKFTTLEVCSEQGGGASARLLPEGEEVFDLPGRIREISSGGQDSSVMAVRTDYTCSFFTRECGQDENEKPAIKVIGNLACQTKPCSVAVNPFIPGEVVVAMETGSLCLWCERDASSLRVVKQCSASSADEFDWYCCEFGPHPRQVIRANKKNVEILDLRDNLPGGKDLMTLPSRHFFEEDQFVAIQRHPGNPFHYILATDQSLVILDERFPQHPVLKWSHSFHRPIKHITVVPGVFPDSKDVLVFAGSFREHIVHCFQYCSGASTPHSLGMMTSRDVLPAQQTANPWKISSYSEWLNVVDYPSKAQIWNEATRQLNHPLVGLSCIPDHLHNRECLVVLQLSETGNLFYQCLSPSRTDLTEERDHRDTYYYENLDLDISGSSEPVFAERDKEAVDKWLTTIKQWQTQASNAIHERNSTNSYDARQVGLVRAKVFSQLGHSTQCSLCTNGVEDGEIGTVGDCFYCGLSKAASDKLSSATTSETVILTNASLGIKCEPDKLKIFDRDGKYNDPLGRALLKNWDADVPMPIDLQGEGKEEKDSDVENQSNIENDQVSAIVNNNTENTSRVTEELQNEESQASLMVNNCLEPDRMFPGGRQIEMPMPLREEIKSEDNNNGSIDCLLPGLTQQTLSPALSQAAPRKSSIKKKTVRVTGF